MSNVKQFGAKGDGRTDDFEAILHAYKDGDGLLEFQPGDYVVAKTIRLDLTKRLGIAGSEGTAKIIATGKGPVFHLIGTHDKSADPTGFREQVWSHERMPTALNI